MADKPPKKPPSGLTPPIGVPPMGPDWNESTGVRELARAQAQALAEQQAEQRAQDDFRRMQLQLASLFGIDDRPGIIENMEAKQTATDARVDAHEKQIGGLVEFRGRIVWVAGGALSLVLFLGTIAAHYLEKAFGW